MNNYYNFGESFVYNFYVRDGKGGFEDLSSVTDAPSIYIYDSLPSRTDARAGTGALQSVSSWTDANENGGKTFTIASISDPDATDAKDSYEYYIAVNYKLVDSGDVLTDIRLLPMVRARATHAPITTNEVDLQRIYSKVDSISSSADQLNKIQQAKNDIRVYLDSKGYDWAEVWEPVQLNDAIAYRALHLIMIDNMRDTDDAYATRSILYSDQSDNILKGVRLKFKDSSETTPTAEDKNISSFISIIR
jgi:hypothetical protein